MNNAVLDTIRMDQGKLLEELRSAGAHVRNANEIRCPFHDDRHPSAGVYRGDDGVYRYKCHGCGVHGDIFDVRSRVTGQSLRDVLTAARSDAALPGRQCGAASKTSEQPRIFTSIDLIVAAVPGQHEETYLYRHPDTRAIELLVIRWHDTEGKHFWQASPVPGGFVLKKPDGLLPIYNRARIRASDHVVVVEGEKCVHTLQGIGIVATTSPGGAGKARCADWSPLAGKLVYLWADNDPPDKKGVRTGIAHMRDVARILSTLDPPARVMWIDCDQLGLPAKGDVVDFLQQHAEESNEAKRLLIENVLADAEALGPLGEVRSLLADTISGRRKAIDLPFRVTSQLTRMLLPGTVTLLCGDPGATKSFMLLQFGAHWLDQRVKFAILELEDERAFHCHRSLAQKAGMAELLDDAWVRDNPQIALGVLEQYQDFVDQFGTSLFEPPSPSMTLAEIAKWIDGRARAGCRIIAVDPITAGVASEKCWIDDLQFMLEVKQTMRQFDASLILVTHPRRGRKNGTTLDDLAGGAAYVRFAPTVIWLEPYHPARQVVVRQITPCGTLKSLVTANRGLLLRKVRNGPGGGLQVAFNFDGAKLSFEELGVIVKEEVEDT